MPLPRKNLLDVGRSSGRGKYRVPSLDSLDGFPFTAYAKLQGKMFLDRCTRRRSNTESKNSASPRLPYRNRRPKPTRLFGAVQVILMIFGLIALIVSAIGMFNTMISLLERTEESALLYMRPSGAKRVSPSCSSPSRRSSWASEPHSRILRRRGVNIPSSILSPRPSAANRSTSSSSPFWFVSTVILFGPGRLRDRHLPGP